MRGRELILLLLCSGLAGCWMRVSTPQQEFLSPESLLEALGRKTALLESLRAEAVVQIKKGGRRVKVRARLVAARPANFRLEIEDVFGQPLSLLISDGMKYCHWDAQKDSWRAGPATPHQMQQVALIPLDGAELARVFLGEVPLILWVEGKVARRARGRRWLLELSNPRQRQLVEVGTQPLAVERVLLYQKDRLYQQVLLESEQRGELVVPKSVIFEMPDENLLVQVRLREVEPNIPLEASLFSLPSTCSDANQQF
jgi:hypothetical protein